ncbi:tetratricopeptide repeat protein [Herbaspirillum sp. RV1423]|uniref:tetratricopeptide repeat protein n=1 Tax=Herbaspirillum sp. RV1423 TaxID=1443993 RepID=UPI0004B737C5|nr:tetratricopeptide repeat protein [Herbaspirillum sp. RV1423]
MLHDKLLQDPRHLQELMQLLTQSIAADVQGRPEEALDAVERAIALDPAFVPALMRRAGLLLEQERYDEAIEACDDCLRSFPTLEEASQSRQRAVILALEQCQLLLEEHAENADLLCRQATLQMRLERFDEALASLDRALDFAPTHQRALNQRGDVLLHLNRHEEAVLCYDRILAQSAEDAAAIYNRGNVLQKMNCINQALWCYEQALSRQPNFPEAEMAQSYCLLLQGDFAGGWQHHEARWRTGQLRGQGLFPHIPAWLGEPSLEGRSILLWAEQGLGDTIQFARYIPLIAEMAAQVTVCVPETLRRLLSSLVAAPNVTLVSNDKTLIPLDFHCPLMSLPLALSWKLATIPAAAPYLHADTQAKRQWAAALGPRSRLRVGLAWAGRQFDMINYTRDIPLSHLRPLVDIDVELVSLQQQIPSGDVPEMEQWRRMRRFEHDMIDMAETAALIDNLDLVISADTAMIHLAGALGKPAWLLLRYESEWRWGWQTGSSRWYPTVKVFRQQIRGDWSGVVEEVAECLRLAAGK